LRATAFKEVDHSTNRPFVFSSIGKLNSMVVATVVMPIRSDETPILVDAVLMFTERGSRRQVDLLNGVSHDSPFIAAQRLNSAAAAGSPLK
jgi:hypothetical protein